ncbi:hypothetical protein CEXT_658391 [Caerostris extrusa]|uniref:Uncharacterized protein n=1 Tax=Caerostris extrusa TaxID=172846 RepID=A0AAV4R0V3_CAEEX|nr:hypothetical protein CEXT_658391 [Caerostris extrusa]
MQPKQWRILPRFYQWVARPDFTFTGVVVNPSNDLSENSRPILLLDPFAASGLRPSNELSRSIGIPHHCSIRIFPTPLSFRLNTGLGNRFSAHVQFLCE